MNHDQPQHFAYSFTTAELDEFIRIAESTLDHVLPDRAKFLRDCLRFSLGEALNTAEQDIHDTVYEPSGTRHSRFDLLITDEQLADDPRPHCDCPATTFGCPRFLGAHHRPATHADITPEDADRT